LLSGKLLPALGPALVLEIADLSSKSPPPVIFTHLGKGIKAQVSGFMSKPRTP